MSRTVEGPAAWPFGIGGPAGDRSELRCARRERATRRLQRRGTTRTRSQRARTSRNRRSRSPQGEHGAAWLSPSSTLTKHHTSRSRMRVLDGAPHRAPSCAAGHPSVAREPPQTWTKLTSTAEFRPPSMCLTISKSGTGSSRVGTTTYRTTRGPSLQLRPVILHQGAGNETDHHTARANVDTAVAR